MSNQPTNAEKTAQQAYDDWRRGVRWTLGCLAAFLFVTLIGWDRVEVATHGCSGVVTVWVWCAPLALTLLGCFMAMAFLAMLKNGIRKILDGDCDAQKMLEVAAICLDRTHLPASRRRSKCLYAVCSHELGYNDVAFQWANEVICDAGASLSQRLSALSVIGAVYGAAGKAEELRRVRDDAAACVARSRVRGQALESRQNIVRAMDARLAQLTGDANAWRTHLERESMGASQQRMRVHATFQLAIQYERDAREARAAGDEARARELEAIAGEKYARVARFGGTLACARQAQAWLDARQA